MKTLAIVNHMKRIQFEISKINEYRNTLLEFRNQYIGLESYLLDPIILNEKEKRIKCCILLSCKNEKLASVFIKNKIRFLRLNALRHHYDCLFIHKVDKDKLNND